MPEPKFKGWPTAELGTVAKVNAPHGDLRVPPGKKLQFIDFKGTRDEPGLLVDPTETTRQTPPAGSRIVREGDVLVAKYFPHTGKARTAIVSDLGGTFAYVSPDMQVIRPGRRLSPKWLWHLLRRPSLSGFLDRDAGVLSTAGRVTPRDLEALPIPLPPLAAQQAIVALLEDAEDARRLQRESSAETERALAAAFSEMFGDALGNSDKGEQVILAELIERIDRGRDTGIATLKRSAGDGEYGLLTPAAVTSGRFLPGKNFALGTSTKPGNRRPVAKGDLLMAWMGERESVGATAIVEDDYDGLFLPDTLWRLVPWPGVDVHFLKAFLSAPETRRRLRDLASGGSVARLPRDVLHSLPAFVPSGAAQVRFADLYRALVEARAMQDELGAELDRLLEAMLSRAYTSRPQTAAKARAKKASAKKGSRATRKRAAARSAEAGLAAASAVSEAESRTVWGKLSVFQRAVWAASLNASQQFRVGDIMRDVNIPADTSADRERFLSALDVLVSLGAIIREGRLDADRWRRLDPESDREVGL
jgi:type I restriction enzyme S subunit